MHTPYIQEAIAENKRVVADYQEKVYKLSVEIAGIKGDTAESHSGEGSGGAATAATAASGGDDGQWL